MVNLCYIVGSSSLASNITKILSTSNVPSMYYERNAIEIVRSASLVNRNLRVIVVFSNDFEDGGRDILQVLTRSDDGNIPTILVVRNGTTIKKEIGNAVDFSSDEIPVVPEFFDASPYNEMSIGGHIKRRYFPDIGAGAHLRKGKLPVVTEPDSTPILSQVSKKQALPIRHPSQEDVTSANMEGNSLYATLIEDMRRNDPLPDVSIKQNITGKGQQTVLIDPRRIRPLPDNPRSNDNPGFTIQSLTALGESIRLTGQLEDVLVCPISDDPQYDAQLVDGERRHRSCLLTGVMIYATVREDITPEMARQLYLLSVVRNHSKVPMMLRETIVIVKRFRGPEYRMSIEEVATIFGGKSRQWVMTLEKLSRLHPDVLAMLADIPDKNVPNADTKEMKRKARRRGNTLLTQQHGQLLLAFPQDEQLRHAEYVVSSGMNFGESRRYLLAQRGNAGLKRGGGRNRSSDHFRSLRTFSEHSTTALGIFMDMTEEERVRMFAGRPIEERRHVQKKLADLQELVVTLLKRPELKV